MSDALPDTIPTVAPARVTVPWSDLLVPLLVTAICVAALLWLAARVYRRLFRVESLPWVAGVFAACSFAAGDIYFIAQILREGMQLYGPALATAITTAPPSGEYAELAASLGDLADGAEQASAWSIAQQWMLHVFGKVPLLAVVRILLWFPLMIQLAGLTAVVDRGAVRPGPVLTGLGRIAPARRQALGILAAFLVSLYLCLAALVAFPWFRTGEVPDQFGSKALLEALNAPRSLLRITDSLPRSIAEARPLDALERCESRSAVDGAADGATVCRSERLRAERARNELWRRWYEFQLELREEGELAHAKAVQEYDLSLQLHMSTSERAAFFGRVSEWYRFRARGLERRSATATSLLGEFDRRLERWAALVVGRVEAKARGATSGAASADTRLEALEPLWELRGPGSWVRRHEGAFRLRATTDERLRPPDPGADFGPFGVVARWLLRTRSESLAVLTGMLGFGLFGAMIARFVRGGIESLHQPGGWSLVAIQGFSAAIVVFLAVQGGMNVFSTGERDVNPYTLCLACLVGAVFSERVWSWARDRVGMREPQPQPPARPPANPA